MAQELSLVEWHKEVQQIAEEKGFGFVISDDPKEHVHSYNADASPDEAVEEAIAEWSDN